MSDTPKKANKPTKKAAPKKTVSDEEMQNAIKAGWNPADGAPPHTHGAEPGDDVVPEPEHLPRLLEMARETYAMGQVDWNAVLAELQSTVGFDEGPNNQNPYTEEQGAGDAAYCCAHHCIIPYHHGVQWPANCQYAEKGNAYVPTHRNIAIEQGWWEEDHASQGHPATARPGDGMIYGWPGGDGAGDHIETLISANPDGTTTNIGANTKSGSPADGKEGVKTVTRTRAYLLGVVHNPFYTQPTPTPPPAPPPPPVPTHAPDGNPFTMLTVDGGFGPLTTKALQWRLNLVGANPQLVVDGEYGPATKTMLQARLNATNPPVAIDGDVGPQTISALQAHTGAVVDGQWGPDTTRHLQAALNNATF